MTLSPLGQAAEDTFAEWSRFPGLDRGRCFEDFDYGQAVSAGCTSTRLELCACVALAEAIGGVWREKILRDGGYTLPAPRYDEMKVGVWYDDQPTNYCAAGLTQHDCLDGECEAAGRCVR